MSVSRRDENEEHQSSDDETDDFQPKLRMLGKSRIVFNDSLP